MSFVKKVLFAAAFILGLSAAIELSFFHIPELVNEKTRLTMLSDDITWYSGDPLVADKSLGMSDISRHIYEDPVYTTIPMKEVYLSRFSLDYKSNDNSFVTTVLSHAEQSRANTYHGPILLMVDTIRAGYCPCCQPRF